jgi:hypothetical protein
MDLSKIKITIGSKIKKLTAQIFLSEHQKKLLKNLFSSDEQTQLAAAIEIGKEPDLQLFGILSFYLKDDFLDELFLAIHEGGFKYAIAKKNTIKFYSLIAVSSMLEKQGFFETILGIINSKTESDEERADAIFVLSSIFEEVRLDWYKEEKISDKKIDLFFEILLSILDSDSESIELKTAAFLSIKKLAYSPIRQKLSKEINAKIDEAIIKYKKLE